MPGSREWRTVIISMCVWNTWATLLVRANLRGNDTSTARIFCAAGTYRADLSIEAWAPKQGMNTLKGRVSEAEILSAPQTD